MRRGRVRAAGRLRARRSSGRTGIRRGRCRRRTHARADARHHADGRARTSARRATCGQPHHRGACHDDSDYARRGRSPRAAQRRRRCLRREHLRSMLADNARRAAWRGRWHEPEPRPAGTGIPVAPPIREGLKGRNEEPKRAGCLFSSGICAARMERYGCTWLTDRYWICITRTYEVSVPRPPRGRARPRLRA